MTPCMGPRPRPLAERLADKFLVGDNCWPWIGARDGKGYGQISVGSIRDGTATRMQAHRAVYELLVGPIPAGLHIDHLCANPNCVRPDHLEPVTQTENNRRVAERNTACRRGHPITPESTYARPDGRRDCRDCRRMLGW